MTIQKTTILNPEIQKEDITYVSYRALSALFLGGFVILSLLSSDSLSELRLIFFCGFILFTVFRFKITRPIINYGFLVTIILLLSLIAFYRGYSEYGKYALLEAKLIIVYVLIFSALILFINTIHLKVIENAIVIGSILVSLYFFYFVLGSLHYLPFFFGDFLNQGYNIELAGRVKIYGNNISILTYLFPYVLLKTFLKDGSKRLNAIALILTGLSTLISLRRGVILSGLLGVLITFLILSQTNRKILKRIFLLALLLIGLLSVYVGISNVSVKGYKKEILSSFDFKTNASNIIRFNQINFFIEKIKEKPLMGYGLGAHDPKYIRSNDNPAHYELGYFKMIYAGGLIIFLANFLLFLWGLNKARTLIQESSSFAKKIAPSLAGWLSLVIYHASNPIFSQFSYLFFYFHLFYLVHQYSLKTENWHKDTKD